MTEEERREAALTDACMAVVTALRADRVHDALRALPSARAIAQRPAVIGRLAAWEAQCHLRLGDARAAQSALRTALRVARETGEPEALAALQPLQQQAFALAAAARARAAAPETPLGAAMAAFDQGDHDTGIAHAESALAAATEPRDRVLALLALARAPAQAAARIRAAADVADEADDHNLITAVARAARAADVTLDVHIF